MMFGFGPLTTKKDTEVLERVQRRATKLGEVWSTSLRGSSSGNVNLEKRRLRGDVVTL